MANNIIHIPNFGFTGNTVPTFSVQSFTSNSGGTTFEYGTGTWKDVGELSFSATYNDVATGAYITNSSWTGNLVLSTPFTGPIVNTEPVTYPSAAGAVRTFTIMATNGTLNASKSLSIYFNARRYWGVSTVTGSYTEANVESLGNHDLVNNKAKTFTLTVGTGNYAIYAYPARLGDGTFYFGSFQGGWLPAETVSITSGAGTGATEDYFVYRSANPGLGNITVTVV
jgi:hypothetical protein